VDCESCSGQTSAFLLLKAIPKLLSSELGNGLATPLSAVRVGEGGGRPGMEDFKMTPLPLESSEEDGGCCGVGEVFSTATVLGLGVGLVKTVVALGATGKAKENGAGGAASPALALLSARGTGKEKDGAAVEAVVVETGTSTFKRGVPAGGCPFSVFGFTGIANTSL